MKHTIELYLGGDEITSDKLTKGILAFYGLLNEIASEITGEKKILKWLVVAEKGSISLVNRDAKGVSENDIDTLISSVSHGVTQLEQSPVRPQYFNDDALEYLEDLAYLPSRDNGTKQIGIGIDNKRHFLTHHVIANVENLLAVYGKALGSIEGRLSTISERGGLKIVVYERLTDRPVRCHLNEDMIEHVTSAFGKRVYVFGLISYGKDRLPKSIKVEELKIYPDKDKLPTAHDVCGILRA